MASTFELFVACAPGLEPILALEVEQILGQPPKSIAGGVSLRGTVAEIARLNLELGVATQVLVRIAKFPSHHFSQLDKSLQKVNWSAWIVPGAPVAVRVSTHKSKLYHSKGIEQRVRGALQARLKKEAPVLETEDGARLLVRIDHDHCTVSVDSSGAPLHRRGYRLASAKAPLREDLARAVVRLSGWDTATPFADPFCGSGTLGIEAAMLARGMAPGLNRNFAFESWPTLDPELCPQLRSEAKAKSKAACAAPIWLSDRDAGAVQAAKDNAARASVLEDLHIEEAPMGRAPFLAEPPAAGAWVSNPPHGTRIGKKDQLRSLHQSIGRRFEGLSAQWGLTLVVRDRRLAYTTGLSLETQVMTEHGGSKIWVLGSNSEKEQ